MPDYSLLNIPISEVPTRTCCFLIIKIVHAVQSINQSTFISKEHWSCLNLSISFHVIVFVLSPLFLNCCWWNYCGCYKIENYCKLWKLSAMKSMFTILKSSLMGTKLAHVYVTWSPVVKKTKKQSKPFFFFFALKQHCSHMNFEYFNFFFF